MAISLKVFVGSFSTLRKVSISFVMCVSPSVGPSVRMEELDFHSSNFQQISYLSIFLKIREENSISVIYRTSIAVTVHEDQHIFLIISRSILLE